MEREWELQPLQRTLGFHEEEYMASETDMPSGPMKLRISIAMADLAALPKKKTSAWADLL